MQARRRVHAPSRGRWRHRSSAPEEQQHAEDNRALDQHHDVGQEAEARGRVEPRIGGGGEAQCERCRCSRSGQGGHHECDEPRQRGPRAALESDQEQRKIRDARGARVEERNGQERARMDGAQDAAHDGHACKRGTAEPPPLYRCRQCFAEF
eukprot:655038-Prymnesium_polylepis.2